MSQEKVDKYKKEKANRKKAMAKEKFKKRLYVIIGALIGVAFLGWIGFSVYNDFIKEQETEATMSAEEYSELLEYLNAQATASTAETTTGSDDTTADSEETTGQEETTDSAEETSAE